jgi:hypothetical protein
MNKRKYSTIFRKLFSWCGHPINHALAVGAILLSLANTAFASCTFSIDNEWNTGYVASITIKNDTVTAISSWNLNWQFTNNRMTSGWNANFSGTNPYTATNLSWNGNIAVGQSISFGFQVEKNGGATEHPMIHGAACGGTTVSSSRSSASLSVVSTSSSRSIMSSSSSSISNNFAQNGGVESDLTNWGTTAGTVTRTTADKHSGLASALISSRTAAWNGLTFNVGTLTTGNQYDVAVWVKLTPGTPDSVISLTAKRQDDADTSTYNEYTRVATATATASGWTLLQGYYTQLGSTAFQHFIIEATDATISYYADDFSISGEVIRTSSSSSSTASSAPSCDLRAPLRWTSTAPLISPKNAGWVSIKDPSVVKYNDKFYVYATYVDTGYKSMYTSFSDWGSAQQAAHISMNGSRVGNTVAPQVFYFKPHKKWYLITQWPGSYATTDDIANPNWSTKQKLLQGEPSNALDFWVICNDTHCYLYFSRDDGVLYVSKTTIANFPNFSGYSIVMEDHRGNGSNYLFEASNVYKLDGQNKYLLMVEAYISGPRFFRSWTSTSLDGPWAPLADTETNPFAGNNNVEWPTGKWANGISHGELIRSGYDEKMTIDPCNIQFLYQGESGPGATYDTIPYKLGLLTLKK